MNNIQLRPIQRKGFCRGCDERLEVGTYIVYTYSHRNRGQNIVFCMDCAKEIGKLAEKVTKDLDK